jgi:hypothetical protein
MRPIEIHDPPHVDQAGWSANPIDAFILAKLQEQGLSPSAPASKSELLRRVTFDLTGLPPTPEEMEAFLEDQSPAAYEKIVDRLLASPRYGERWGRHWLDVVRYGESQGYEQNHLRPTAWHYRDYVIRAFNEDKPYDRFITEQLAGDLVGKGDPLVEPATGYLVAGVHDTVGIANVEGSRQQRANDLDDIVSTTGAAFLGLTVGCARCHDHKFDPIPQRDYYRLSAVFAGVRYQERPLPVARSADQIRELAVIDSLIKETHGALQALDAEAKKTPADATAQAAAHPARPPVNAQQNTEDFQPVQARFVRFTVLSTIDGANPCIDELEIYPPGGGENLALASTGAKATASSLLPGYSIHQVSHLNDGRYGNAASWISNEPGKGWAQIELSKPAQIGRVVWSRDRSSPVRYRDRAPLTYRVDVSMDGVAWRTVSSDEGRLTPVGVSAEPSRDLSTADRRERKAIAGKLAELERRRAAVLAPAAYIGQFTAPDPIHLLKRGDVMQPLEEVQPGALSQVPGMTPELSTESSESSAGAMDEPHRRLGLARWLCRNDNPLTARVMVNRIWQHHFGRGIVATPSDFGANGMLPSHRELLDYLAADFIKNGWRIKRMHRMMVLSSAYRQASRTNPQGLAKDAGDIYLWHMPLRRLESEAVRDSILAVSGKLDPAMGGPGYQLFKYHVVNIGIYEPLEEQGPQTYRRAIYQQLARSIHDELLGSFDEPECAMREPRRETTTTPLQALTLLNSSFVTEQAEFLAQRVQRDTDGDEGTQVDRVYWLALGRAPGSDERLAAIRLVKMHGMRLLCRAMFNADEFLNY